MCFTEIQLSLSGGEMKDLPVACRAGFSREKQWAQAHTQKAHAEHRETFFFSVRMNEH